VGARFLQECRPFVPVDFAPLDLPSFISRATFVTNVGPVLPSVDPAAAVGKHSPLLALAARAERDGQQHVPSRASATHPATPL
jgi:hypothetical protein